MILLIIIIGLFAAAILKKIISWISYKKRIKVAWMSYSDEFADLSIIATSVILGIVLILLACLYGTAPKERASHMEQYEVIMYEKEHYKELDISKKLLLDDIAEWNADIVSYKMWQQSPVIGVFFPDVYGELEKIEVE